MSAPRVSVLMGVHDGERYLREAIDSVLAQTISELELVVVDDCSADATASILAEYADPRLVIVRNETNLGLTKSLNLALARSSGHFVARQDADDRSLPRRLERQLAFLEQREDVVLCGTWARLIGPDGSVVSHGRPPSDPAELAAGLRVENKIFHGSLLARRELMESLGGYREAFRYSQDYDLYLRACDRHALANVPEELYELRFHPGAITGSKQAVQHRYRELARRLAEQRRERGNDDLAAGRPADELLAGVELDADSAAFWRHRAFYARLMGDVGEFRRALVRTLRRNPADLGAYLQLVVSLGGVRALDATDRLWRRVTENEPGG